MSRVTSSSSFSIARWVLRWSGQAAIGLPPMQISAFTWPSPSSRISSANAAVGIPLTVSVRPRTRSRSP